MIAFYKGQWCRMFPFKGKFVDEKYGRPLKTRLSLDLCFVFKGQIDRLST